MKVKDSKRWGSDGEEAMVVRRRVERWKRRNGGWGDSTHYSVLLLPQLPCSFFYFCIPSSASAFLLHLFHQLKKLETCKNWTGLNKPTKSPIFIQTG